MPFNVPDLRKKSEALFNLRRSNTIENFFDRFFNDLDHAYPLNFQESGSLSPRTDLAETDSTYYIDVDMAGVNQKDIELKIENNILNIKGKREEKEEQKGRDYYIREHYYGSLQRSLSLPANVDSDNVKAKFENGVLHIEIPKKEQKTAKKIEIKS